MKLSTANVRMLKNARDRGNAFDGEIEQGGGARTRMAHRLAEEGLLVKWNWTITDAGRKALNEVLGVPPT